MGGRWEGGGIERGRAALAGQKPYSRVRGEAERARPTPTPLALTARPAHTTLHMTRRADNCTCMQPPTTATGRVLLRYKPC